jgi:hypothetical protein
VTGPVRLVAAIWLLAASCAGPHPDERGPRRSAAEIQQAAPVSGGDAQACPIAPGWFAGVPEEPSHHRVVLDARVGRDGRIKWGGSEISEDLLATYLRRTRRMNPSPYLLLRYQRGLSCSALHHVRQIFVGNAGCGVDMNCGESAFD